MGLLSKEKCFVLFVVCVLNFCSCATVFTGGTTSISLNTPDGKVAEVEVVSASGTQNITIPSSIMVTRSKAPVHVRVTDETCEQTSVTVAQEVNIPFYANFLFGLFGTTSAGVDASTGAMWTYDENIIVPVKRKDLNTVRYSAKTTNAHK
ncbi:hypothetical protein [Desulfoluna spongiiphila]|uniref:hypothetical protein n=1 Tax=Desulfoluna spongiiphila TaxID=419481 RepID=UPI00125F493F|nr:hypothetical protein [Desulfoluna spongiiphila]